MSTPAGAWRLDAALDGRTFEVRPGPGARGGQAGAAALVRRALIVADVVGLALAFLVTELIFGTSDLPDRPRRHHATEYLLFLATLPGWVVVAKLYRLYDNDDERTDHTTIEDFVGVFHLVTVGTWRRLRRGVGSRAAAEPECRVLVAFWLLGVALVTIVTRRRARTLPSPSRVPSEHDRRRRRRGRPARRRKLLMHREYGINLLGFVDADPRERRPDLERPVGAGRCRTSCRSSSTVSASNASSSPSPSETNEDTAGSSRAPGATDVQVDIVPRLFERRRAARQGPCRRGLPLVALPTVKRFPFSRPIKRIVRRRRCHAAPARLVTDLCPRGVADPARLAGPGVLPPDAARP